MAEVDLHPDVVRAIKRVSKSKLGKQFDRYAEKNFHISGKTLAARQTAGEFGGRSTKSGRNVVSSAGARGPAQFISSTRDAFIQKYGIDPWKNDKSAIKGLMLHDLSTGVAGYNPGMPSYTNYVLGQRIAPEDRKALRQGVGSPAATTIKGAPRTKVSLGPTTTTPGVSYAAERDAAKRNLLLGGDLTLEKLLQYKSTVDGLQDVPATKKLGELQVKKVPGKDIKVQASGGAPVGTAILASSADRAGVSTKPEVLRFVRHLSGRAQRPLTIGTGTNHNQMTTTGNVSDHWTGHAADIPSSGASLTRLGQKALIQAGMPKEQARKQKGGVYNLQHNGHRIQILFNTTVGGNHFNHLHVGIQ